MDDISKAREQGLFFTVSIPRATGLGRERRGWQNLTAVARTADVTLICLTYPGNGPSREDIEAIRAVTANFCFVDRLPSATPADLAGASLLSQILTGRFAPVRIPDRDMEKVASFLDQKTFDFCLCFKIESAGIWQSLKRQLSCGARSDLVDFDDIESEYLWRKFKVDRRRVGFEISAVTFVSAIQTRLFENFLLRHANDVLITSAVDLEKLNRRKPRAKISVAPNVVPASPRMSPRAGNDRYKVVFVGAMGYPPNVDGAIFFCTEILPRLRTRADKPVDVTIVGFNPAPEVTVLGEIEGVTVTGGVPEVGPYYGDADLSVVPIRFGGGTRIKILEALMLGRPVVSTTIGAEGLDFRDGKEIMIADEALAFAEACAKLLADPDYAGALSSRGRQAVIDRFGEVRIQEIFRDLLAG